MKPRLVFVAALLLAPVIAFNAAEPIAIHNPRQHYDQLELGDRAVLEFFDSPHTIHGQGTFRFLHHFLNEPAGR